MFGQAATRQTLRVKICGITNRADAFAALDAGADAIGVNCFRGSKRYVDIRDAGEWLTEVPATLTKVAVVVDLTLDETLAIARLPFIDSLQLHGRETPEFCATLAREGIAFGKAVPVVDAMSLAGARRYSTDTIVMDAMSGGHFGGTGETFPWEIARRFVEEHPSARAILAGGLAPENIAAAVRSVRPFGVDVTTGVETSPGRKDHEAVKRFVAAARAA